MRNPTRHNKTPLKIISSSSSEQDYDADDESDIKTETESENEIITIFSAISDNDQESLKDLIKENPKSLEQEDEDGLKPVFFAIFNGNLEALEIMIEANPKILEQEDEDGNLPIIKAIEYYDTNNSEENKNILETIFKKQFGEDLTDVKIENLVNFVRGLYLLNLVYNESGQNVDDIHLKKIISSVAPKQEDEQSELGKNLIEIYQKISLEEMPIITIPDKKNIGKNNNLYIYLSKIEDHSSYFIFHVNNEGEGKLTAISYCDGNQTYYMEKELRLNDKYINGVTTYKLENPVDFSEKMAINFIERNAKHRGDSVYQKITGIDNSTITYSIPIKEQTKGNCALKSFNVLWRFMLEQERQEKLFDFDEKTSKTIGDGNYAYKKLKQKMIENATQQIVENSKEIGKDFYDKVKIFENLKEFIEKSLKKEKLATKFPKSSIELIKDVLAPKTLSTISRKRNISELEESGSALPS
jgi:ankyrin repeat protein